LLGTGGNDGRLDFTNNFMQRLGEVLPFAANEEPTPESAGWLRSALFGEGIHALTKAAVGQFNPGGIGGANAVQGKFEADSRVNPWDFVLMIEGAMLFAGSVARRLGTDTRDRASFPFTVQPVAVGYGAASASDETTDGSRAELWLPLWRWPAPLAEVSHIFAEGRAQFGRRQARNAVEFALAACMLGVSRGIDSFARYGFLKRNGLAFLAAPLARVPVQERPVASLLDDPALTRWLERLRKACRDKEKTPARYQVVLREIDRAMFAFAVRAQKDSVADRKALREVLAAIGRAERTLAKGLRFCEDGGIPPLQSLRPEWLLRLLPDGPEEGWCEFRLAAALASILAAKASKVGPLRVHLEEVEPGGRVWWSPGSTSAVWSNRPLDENLAAVFLRRWLETERGGGEGLALGSRVTAPLVDVLAFLNEETDDEALADLLWGMIGIRWTDATWFRDHRPAVNRRFRASGLAMLRDFALIRLITEPLVFASDRVGPGMSQGDGGRQAPADVVETGAETVRWRVIRAASAMNAPAVVNEKDRRSLPPEGSVKTRPIAAPFHLLSRGAKRDQPLLDDAMDLAAHQLWAAGLVPFGWQNRRRRQLRFQSAMTFAPGRLVAACLFPLSQGDLGRLANGALSSPKAANP
jgi:CRISPR-associated protein Csx17